MDPSGLYWRPPARGKASRFLDLSDSEVRADSWTFPPRAVFDDPVWQDSNPPHNAAPSPSRRSSRDRHTGHKRRRSVGGTPGRRRLASEDHQTSEVRRPEDNHSTLYSLRFSRLAHVCFSYHMLALPHWAERERSMPIFGVKPERNACAHIWGEARAQHLCPYLGRSQHTNVQRNPA